MINSIEQLNKLEQNSLNTSWVENLDDKDLMRSKACEAIPTEELAS